MDLSTPGVIVHVIKGIIHLLELAEELRRRGWNPTPEEHAAFQRLEDRMMAAVDPENVPQAE